jgi:hypothetical protein
MELFIFPDSSSVVLPNILHSAFISNGFNPASYDGPDFGACASNSQ